MPSKRIVKPIFPPKNKWVGTKLKVYEHEVEKYLKGPATRILKGDMEATVENWKGAPEFVSDYSEPFGTRKQIYVHPKGKHTTKWQRVSGGVRARPITPRRPDGMLVFKRYHTPKTRPGGKVFWGGPGSRSGPTVRSKRVEWPGIEPREFSKEIVSDREAELVRGVDALTRKVFK